MTDPQLPPSPPVNLELDPPPNVDFGPPPELPPDFGVRPNAGING